MGGSSRIRPAYRLAQILIQVVFRTLFGLKIRGRDNVPKSGGFLLASNHKSWFDPPLVGSSCPREIFYAAKQELFNSPIMGPVVSYFNSVPVRRSGYDRAILIRLAELLKAGNGAVIFPEGTRFLDNMLHNPRAGVGMLAMLVPDIPIVPVCVQGSAKLSKRLFDRGLTVTFGKPVHAKDFLKPGDEGKAAYRAIAVGVMEHIALTGGMDKPSFEV